MEINNALSDQTKINEQKTHHYDTFLGTAGPGVCGPKE